MLIVPLFYSLLYVNLFSNLLCLFVGVGILTYMNHTEGNDKNIKMNYIGGRPH